ncbi:MAG: 50S ribosomal protein L3 N(5)-glutamine methyltransferase [Gammaproteobacteria bacterium]|nr:50S ribosomal protein L3 N(5)-glutamine methyltransferase [Gammaproteobacteria bacterium]MCP4088899.1 50S ribosomal protein L3 N(5)-glutamine methyltransferase [Gammaproteobacteria bacterium]MCP4274915.1 50S ribosomal protein L3 N(5)-glutamine methyltransferase [Gammaproteobacteria bacterium]MCP4832018.1 50S ribosomal protein L3 N(5)-glutamine methyltransferase [Gammaproteobacteria bacterium]MCP4929453.1 50S ribosomal protein L3 N(5)-glutamine methyltransferase [Gammaproteobacteria bacterium
MVLKVGQLIEDIATGFAQAELFYGHGTDNPYDEAAALVFHVMGLEHAGDVDQYQHEVTTEQHERVQLLSVCRVETRKPLAYLLKEAWFAGIRFTVDERVLIPRSPLAELITGHFEPWVNQDKVSSILEVGTGSGCIAIACALEFPTAQVTATDISPDALEVARLNTDRYQLAEQVSLVKADLLDGIEGSFDIIISNPPYVPDHESAELPSEYLHEPVLGLFSGADGLDSARRILQDAPRLLSAGGILVLEVGAQWEALEQAFPSLPFIWLEFEHGGEGVAVLQAVDLQQ